MSRNRPSDSDFSGTGGDSISLGFWNAAGKGHPIEPLIEWLRDSDLDLLALVESAPMSAADREICEQALPGWRIVSLRGGRAVFCRGELGKQNQLEWENLPGRSSVLATSCRLGAHPQQEIRLVIADVDPNPFRPRGATIDRIFNTAGKGPATIVVGDFNTPVESVHFDAWQEHFLHGATQGGIGYRETWPWFAPLLCIDHLWFSPDFEVHSARRKNFPCSDHSLVVVEVKIPHPGDSIVCR